MRGLYHNSSAQASFLESNSPGFLALYKVNWKTQWILGISLWGDIWFNWRGNCYSYTWSCNLCEGGTSFSTRLILRKLFRFLSLDSYSYFQLTFSPMEILIMLFQFLLAFLQTLKVFSFSFHIFWLYSCWMTDLRDPLTNVSCNNIFNLYDSATAASL